MAKLCPRGKAAAKRKFKVYPSAYANMYASAVCSGKVTPGGKKRKKAMGGGLMTRPMYKKGGDVIVPPKKPKKEIIRDPILKPIVKVLKNLKETIYEGKNMKSNVIRGPIRAKRMGGGVIDMTRMKYLKGGQV